MYLNALFGAGIIIFYNGIENRITNILINFLNDLNIWTYISNFFKKLFIISINYLGVELDIDKIINKNYVRSLDDSKIDINSLRKQYQFTVENSIESDKSWYKSPWFYIPITITIILIIIYSSDQGPSSDHIKNMFYSSKDFLYDTFTWKSEVVKDLGDNKDITLSPSTSPNSPSSPLSDSTVKAMPSNINYDDVKSDSWSNPNTSASSSTNKYTHKWLKEGDSVEREEFNKYFKEVIKKELLNITKHHENDINFNKLIRF